jgi:hypothetical protein
MTQTQSNENGYVILAVGQAVQGGDPYTPDWDKGVIEAIQDGGCAVVAWSSGVKTNTPIGLLIAYDGTDYYAEAE